MRKCVKKSVCSELISLQTQKLEREKKTSLSFNVPVHHLANLSEFDSTVAQVFVFSSGLTAISDSSSVFVQ